jgi:hypothetical protein
MLRSQSVNFSTVERQSHRSSSLSLRGISIAMPYRLSQPPTRLQLHSLSPASIHRRLRSRPTGCQIVIWSITASTHEESCTCAAVTSTVSGRPCPSQTTWNLLHNPPHELAQSMVFRLVRAPTAASCGSVGCGSIGQNRRAVDAPEIRIDVALDLESGVQGFDNPVGHTCLNPPSEAVVHNPSWRVSTERT